MSRQWKIAFCGLGSIGSRHLRNLKDIFNERGDIAKIDWIQHEDREIPKEFINTVNNVYEYEDKIPDDYDVIFITNSTHMHKRAIELLQWHTKALFIEKPLFAFEGEELEQINSNCIYYVACPVRYKKVIQYIKKNVKSEDILCVSAVCSSYLPEWRPNTDYRKCYSAFFQKGGGVSLDLIHELDYLSYLLGDIGEIYNIRGQVSPLEIDSDDVSVYIGKINNTIIQVHLDYFGRVDIRKLTLFTADDTIEVDLLSNAINFLKVKKEITFQEKRDDFQKSELLYFLDVLEGKKKNTNNLEQANKLFCNTFGRIK